VELILWRHAEAEIGEPDLGRKLTARGDKQARKMAGWLHARLPDSTRVLASPAARAQQTAQALAELAHRKFRTVEALAPGAAVEDVLAAAEWPDGRKPVLIVGHQPTLGWVASQLLTGAPRDWAIKKGGVWWLQSREREGDTQVVLRAVVSPDLA
jgi:phosphohistidine phosphatase